MKSVPVFTISAADFSRVHAQEIQDEVCRLVKEHGSLVIDMSTVSYVDSVALTLLHNLEERATELGGRLVLAGVHPGVTRVFETMGLEIQLSVSVDAALSSFES